jgi:hypothetical protein
MTEFEKYFAKYTKVQLHQGGSIPFWDWNHSGRLNIETPEKVKIQLNAAELMSLKKLLVDFDSRTGQWKSVVPKVTTEEKKQ